MIIKRWDATLNGGLGAFVKEFPETKAQLIRNVGDTDFVFDSNDKIKPAYLPDSVFDSLYFFGTIDTTPKSIRELADDAITNAASINRSPLGYYWVSGGTRTVSSNGTAQQIGSKYYITEFAPTDTTGGVTVGGGLNTTEVLETGDWLVITKITGDGTVGSPYIVVFGAIENTYEQASTSQNGIVRLSSQTVYANLAGNDVITDAKLKALIDNASFASSGHTHGSILNGGTITATVVAPADTDTILISDTSNSGKVERGITIGTSTTTFLNNAGAWTTPAGTYAHPTQTAINANATDDGINVIDSVTVNTLGHVTAVGTRNLSAATASVPGHMTAAYAAKLDGIATGANAYAHPNHSGDVTSVGDGAQTIAANAVTNAKLADMGASTIKGRATASTGDPEDLTAAQVRTLLNVADGANNYTHPTQSLTQAAGTETTLTDITLIDSLTTNSTGHLTNATWRKLVAGSNVTLTAAADGNISIASSFTNTTYTAKALGGLALDGTAFQMNHPLFVQADAPTTPLAGTIWFDL